MRKAIVLLLALVLTMSLALTAAAAPSAGNAEELPQQTVTAGAATVTVTVTTDLTKLTADQQKEVTEKGEEVKKALAENEEIKETAYVEGKGDCEIATSQETVDLLQKGEMKLFQVGADGKLVELKFEIVNGKVVVKDAIAGPIYFVGKK